MSNQQKTKTLMNKKYLIPPLLNNFDIMSSQENEVQNQHQHHFQELSHVEQKDYFESEPQQPDKNDIMDFLGKMEQVNTSKDKAMTPNRKSQRLEDQQIIVVQEQNEVGSNLDGNQSVILEHIDFANEQHHPQNTPEWEKQEQHNKKKESEIKYVINYIDDQHPAWINQDHSQSSSNIGDDFQPTQFKGVNGISINRSSKNTCVDRISHLDSENGNRPINNSCIAKPMWGKSDDICTPPHLDKKLTFRNILDKWNQQVFPRLEEKYLQDENLFKLASKRKSEFQMERDAKFCQSKNYEQIPQSSNTHQKESCLFKFNKEDTYIQTDLLGSQMQSREANLNEDIANLKLRLQKSMQQNVKMKQRVTNDSNEIFKLKQSVKLRDSQIENIKYKQSHAHSQQQRKWGEQIKNISSKNRELEKIIMAQNQQIKQLNLTNSELQRRMENNLTELSLNNSPSFNVESKQVRMIPDQAERLSQLHSKCRMEIEDLQQYIFDIEQQIAGIDIEVEKRARVLTEMVEHKLTRKFNEQYKIIVQNLKQELLIARQTIKKVEHDKRESQERCSQKEKSLKNREIDVNRMYEQLVQEWRQIQKERQLDKKYRSKKEIRAPLDIPITHSQNVQSPRSNYILDHEKSKLFDAPINHRLTPSYESLFDNRQIGLMAKNKLTFTRNQQNYNSSPYINQSVFNRLIKKPRGINQMELSSSFSRTMTGEENRLGRRQHVKTQPRQNNELMAINNKIQRLRKEINKQLDSIH